MFGPFTKYQVNFQVMFLTKLTDVVHADYIELVAMLITDRCIGLNYAVNYVALPWVIRHIIEGTHEKLVGTDDKSPVVPALDFTAAKLHQSARYIRLEHIRFGRLPPRIVGPMRHPGKSAGMAKK